MIKIAALIIAFGGQTLHFMNEIEVGLVKAKLSAAKLMYADCDSAEPQDPDSFE